MTNAAGDGSTRRTPHLYGASELGVLSVTAPGDAHPRVRYLGGELFVGLDDADGSAVTQGEAQAWDREFVDVLLDASGTGELPSPGDGVVVLTDETVASSFLNDPPGLAAAAAAAGIDGPAVVWALARTTVVIAGAGDGRGVTKALELAEELYAAEAPLVSIHPVVVAGSEWAAYDWSAASEDQQLAVHRAIRLFGVRAYEAQTRVLTSPALNRPGLHVADPKIHVREDGATVTFVAYPKGTASLLPVADSVLIADPAAKLGAMPFGDFLEALGDRAVETELSPTRYFIPGAAPDA